MTKNLVFIASGGRTGTTFFGERLKTVIDDCWSEHTPDVWVGFTGRSFRRIRNFGLWHMGAGRLLGLTGMRPLGQKRLSGVLPTQTCLKRLFESRRRYHDSIPQSLIVESYSRWWMFADCFHELWPEAKLIGVIRDPRDWITSWQRHQPRRQTPQFLSWFPLGPLTPEDLGDEEWRGRWREIGQFGRLGWDWRTIYGQIDGAAEKNNRIRMFRFEDLFSAGGEAMGELVRFAADHGARKYAVRDLSGFADDVRNASHGPRRHWRNWPAEDVRLVDELCGPLMRKYGYGLEPEWLELVQGAKPRAAISERTLHAVAQPG